MCCYWRPVRPGRSRIGALCQGEILIHGIVEFVIKNYNKGYIDRVITTNLTYLPPEALAKPYFVAADMSKFIALIIDAFNHDITIGRVLDPTSRIHELLDRHTKQLSGK